MRFVWWVLTAVMAFVVLVIGKVALDLANKELQGWLAEMPLRVLRLARKCLPVELRHELYDQQGLEAELETILRHTYENRPITAIVKAMEFSVGHVIGLRRCARIFVGKANLEKVRLRIKLPSLLAMTALLAIMWLVPLRPYSVTEGVEKPDLKISIMSTTDMGPFWLAVKKGYFRDAGFTFDPMADVTVAKGTNESVARLHGREVDIAYATYAPVFIAASKGIDDIKLVAAASSAGPGSCLVVTMPSSRIKSVEDLDGARIGVSGLNTTSHMLVMSALRTYGVDYTRVRWIDLPFSDLAGKLAAGEIDAAFVTEPFLSQVRRTVGAVPILDAAVGPTLDLDTAGFSTTAQFAQQYPKTVNAFQRVMRNATAEVLADRRSVEPLLRQYLYVDDDVAGAGTLLNFQSSLDPMRIQQVANLMLELGMVDRKIDAAQLIVKAAL